MIKRTRFWILVVIVTLAPMLSPAFAQDSESSRDFLAQQQQQQQQQSSKPQDASSGKAAQNSTDANQADDPNNTCEPTETEESCPADPDQNPKPRDATKNEDPRTGLKSPDAQAGIDYTQPRMPKLDKTGPLSFPEERKEISPKPNKEISPQYNRKEDVPAEDPNRSTGKVRANPYPTLPSLQELYRQIPSADTKLRRFGANLFLNGTGNIDSLPIDLPVGPDYVLGPGDGLSLNVWGSVTRKFNVPVDRSGQVALPESGAVSVAGLTLASAQDLIQKTMGTQFKNVHIDVSLTRLRTVRVYVVGDVQRPGAYDISSLSTPLNALYIAGGPTAQGSLRTVRHYRQKKLIREVDLYELILRGTQSETERIQPGDTILVPPAGAQVTVTGMVHRPAIYELRNEKQLGDVLDLAGGVLVAATLREITVDRIEAHEKRILLSLKSAAGNDAKDGLDPGVATFGIQDGDRITISPILPYSDATIYLQGHVFRPGKYSYHPGMQIGEILRSYQDMLPEPAEHAEIVRLAPPDNRPTTIEFKLSDVVGGDDPIDLQPFDTIRVFGRYEADPPNVYIYGEVLRPGKYPLTEKMTAAGLVLMAGGFKRSALTEEADIASYVIKDGEKVFTKHATVEIAKALAGNSAADVNLKAEDILTVRQLTGWSDIGASITVKGEVLFPGTYGIEEGEKLSTLLKRAGGFRVDAYPEGAVLERVQIREYAEKSRTQLIQRIESSGNNAKFSPTSSPQEQAALLQNMDQQQQHVLTALRHQPASGRMVIKISRDIGRWENTVNDVQLRKGDVITIPKEPSFVLVSGQVYNGTAFTYIPGRNAGWYLHQAGGPTALANKKEIYVIRANGSVVGRGSSGSWWSGNVLSTTVYRGDTIVVPEKIIGGTTVWKTLMDSAQLASSLAIAARVATSF